MNLDELSRDELIQLVWKGMIDKARKEFIINNAVEFDSNWRTNSVWISVWDNDRGEKVHFGNNKNNYDACIDLAMKYFIAKDMMNDTSDE